MLLVSPVVVVMVTCMQLKKRNVDRQTWTFQQLSALRLTQPENCKHLPAYCSLETPPIAFRAVHGQEVRSDIFSGGTRNKNFKESSDSDPDQLSFFFSRCLIFSTPPCSSHSCTCPWRDRARAYFQSMPRLVYVFPQVKFTASHCHVGFFFSNKHSCNCFLKIYIFIEGYRCVCPACLVHSDPSCVEKKDWAETWTFSYLFHTFCGKNHD